MNKILFEQDGEVQIAVGVEFVRNGKSQRAFASKGIVVSAGNFSSVILQRSGIGKTSDLEKAGISTLVESPNVGYNFQTHYAVGIGIEVETTRILMVMSSDPDQPIPLVAFKRDDGERQRSGRRLQFLGNVFPRFIPVQDVIVNNWDFNEDKPSNIMSIGIVDVNPKSKGTIMVAHSDPEAYPSVDFNPLNNPDDLKYMVDHYIETYNVIKRARKLDPEGLYRVVYPSEDIFHLNEDQKRSQLANYAKASYNVLNHYGGQCRMGTNIQEGVVDGLLNVFGTENLKVADLSIAPILPDGNTALAAQMIGLNTVKFIRDQK